MEEVVLQGTVVHGHELGRRIGFPTANLGLEGLSGDVPATGVYAAHCLLPDGRQIRAMVNVGFRPTVDHRCHTLSIEAHLLDFSADLYGQQLHLTLFHRIRDERRMQSLDELKQQLSLDLEACRMA